MELTYKEVGTVQIPEVQMSVTDRRSLGKYGRMRKNFLQEHKPMTFENMKLDETLFPHLWEVQDTATSRLERMMQEMLTKSPAPDKMKDQMGWVRHMNALKAQAEEVILTELVYA